MRVNITDEEVEYLAEVEREVRDEHLAREREAEWIHRLQQDELRKEEEAMERHKAMVAQDYEDWAIWDELNNKQERHQRKRQVV